MASVTQRVGLGALGLLLGFGAPQLAAQSWSVNASDPVGIARSGAGVAYGNSLEAAALNPALLGSLRDHASAFMGVGQELEITQVTLQANGINNPSTDRNRFLPSFGAGWRTEGPWSFGVKLDEPFMRHLRMPVQNPVQAYQLVPLLIPSRFEGQAFGMETHRLEAQAAWSTSPNWSFGASLGATQIQYRWANMVRIPVTENVSQPVSATNAAMGLMELGVAQDASKVVPSYSLGFRWAINSRWTLGGAYVGAMSARMDLRAKPAGIAPIYTAINGYGLPAVGVSAFGPALGALTAVRAGSDRLVLPGKLSLGVRQRVNTLFTWEGDVRYAFARRTEVPGYPTLTGPDGTVSGAGLSRDFKNAPGVSLMGELTLGKRWVLRMGVSQDGGTRATSDVEPMLGSAEAFTASAGFGYKVFGGELNLGYQFRKSQTQQTPALDYVWNLNGQTGQGGTTQVEGMGHLWSIGFKKAF